MGLSQHKESERVCPGCLRSKVYPERQETCSRDCADMLTARRRLDKEGPLKLKRLERENESLKAELKQVLECQVLDEDYQRFVGRIERRKVVIPEWTLKPSKSDGAHEVIPVVNWSDAHLDEIVKPAEVQWRNGYGRDVAGMRLKKFTANTIKVAHDFLKGFQYRGLVVNSLGDIFSGSIHEELRSSNADKIMSSLLYWLSPVGAMLKTFADAFGDVTVNCVVGNHGRNSVKPIFKGRVRDNFDWLFMQIIARELAGDERIHFNISESMKLQFKLYDWSCISTHGDECKGGSGIAGMLSPQLIAYSRMKKTYDFTYWFLGHWHNLGAYRNIRVNGCLKGWDEYAMGNNFDYQDPQQDFFLMNAKHGVIGSLPIFVTDPNEPWLKERRAAA